jgi:nicotinate-nucleotide adenylyltransferase
LRRVGLFGGTFNPVHLAHLRAAEEMREQLQLDRVDFVLSAVPPHKPGDQIASVADRRRMLELAIADHPAFALNDVETRREGRSYSVDTVRECHAREPDARFTFIVGADAYRDIESWKEFADLFALCDVAVMTRPGVAADAPPIAIASAFRYLERSGTYQHRSGHTLSFLQVTALMISASDIRGRRAAGQSIRWLVTDAVDAYIRGHDLYAGGRPSVEST